MKKAVGEFFMGHIYHHTFHAVQLMRHPRREEKPPPIHDTILVSPPPQKVIPI
jgi:hypothetical protein